MEILEMKNSTNLFKKFGCKSQQKIVSGRNKEYLSLIIDLIMKYSSQAKKLRFKKKKKVAFKTIGATLNKEILKLWNPRRGKEEIYRIHIQ